jgi:hypothetical protein
VAVANDGVITDRRIWRGQTTLIQLQGTRAQDASARKIAASQMLGRGYPRLRLARAAV